MDGPPAPSTGPSGELVAGPVDGGGDGIAVKGVIARDGRSALLEIDVDVGDAVDGGAVTRSRGSPRDQRVGRVPRAADHDRTPGGRGHRHQHEAHRHRVRRVKEPAPASPIGPVLEIEVVTAVMTPALISVGVRTASAAKNRGKNRPEQTPFAATAATTPQAGRESTSGHVVTAKATIAEFMRR